MNNCPFRVYPKILSHKSEQKPLLWRLNELCLELLMKCSDEEDREMNSVICSLGGTLNHITIDLDQPARLFLVSLHDDLILWNPVQFLTESDFICGYNGPINWEYSSDMRHFICSWQPPTWVEQRFTCQWFRIRANYSVSAELLMRLKKIIASCCWCC